MNVAIIGASENPERFSCRAQKMLIEKGHRTFPVSLTGCTILGEPGYRSVLEIEAPIDTVTVYLNPKGLSAIADEISELRPSRLIFNPGTEEETLASRFRESGIEVVEACTLVMLESGAF